ncbi:MAG: DUF937 domain-containing protein [Hyphomicrobiaceae bacterium]|nr:DUF937 domain-containing protein [Hyphomicrobiaceae bacterium]
MNFIKDKLAGSPDSAAVVELSRVFGTDPAATQAAFALVLDEISRRMERLTLSRGGLADLVRAVGDSHHEAYLKDPRLIGSATMERDGKAILDHVFWSKDRSRGVAARAARQSSISADQIEDMLPSMAALSMAELTRAASGPFDDILRRIPGLDEALKEMQRQSRDGTSGGREDAQANTRPEEAPRTAPQRTGPDRAPAGDLPHQEPLPIPGESMPRPDRGGSRLDDLSDILRRGGFRIPQNSDGGNGSPRGRVPMPDNVPDSFPDGSGGTLYNIIRAVLGALLGFQSRGILSWIIRMVVLRWGWGFLQRILGRVLGRVLVGR